MEIYSPKEDSFMMIKYLENIQFELKGNCLEMGIGSGIISKTLAKFPSVQEISGLDINQDAISAFQNQIDKENFSGKEKIKLYHSDLFSIFEGKIKTKIKKFDAIIFNPPYLPYEPNEDSDTQRIVCGGKVGYELSAKFILQAKEYLSTNGSIYLIVSNLAQPGLFNRVIIDNGYQFEIVAEESHFFEKLFIYKIRFHPALRDFSKEYDFPITKITFLARGKKGIIFRANPNNQDLVIKCQNLFRKDLQFIHNYLKYEGNMLKKLNPFGIGAKLFAIHEDYLVYEYIQGEKLENFLDIATNDDIKTIIILLLLKMFLMDKLQINKEEMTNPYKHVFIDKLKTESVPLKLNVFDMDIESPEKIVNTINLIQNETGINLKLLDFERSKENLHPKNVTQVIQYILGGSISPKLFEKNIINDIDVRSIAPDLVSYKKEYSEVEFFKILNIIFPKIISK